jgi:hypothetical protein
MGRKIMTASVQSSVSAKRVRYQVQARRVERQDDAAWFDMEEVRPMSRKASQRAVDELHRAVPAFVYRAVAV